MKIFKLAAFLFSVLLSASANAQTSDKIHKAVTNPSREKEQAKADVYIQKKTDPVVNSHILIQDSLPSKKQEPPASTKKKKIKIKHKKSSR
ncbi:MAG: hypothetical protein JWN76_163 [Chitinophagaceae bacterium]|nr:hypothetical protein [Chitinophagaceae bacterium]